MSDDEKKPATPSGQANVIHVKGSQSGNNTSRNVQKAKEAVSELKEGKK